MEKQQSRKMIPKQSHDSAKALTALSDASGKTRTVEEFGHPLVLVFFQGFGCQHCVKQLETFAGSLLSEKAKIVCISAEMKSSDIQLNGLPFVVLFDPGHDTFRRFGCYDKRPLHGTLILDERGKIVWKRIGDTPFMDLDVLNGELAKLE